MIPPVADACFRRSNYMRQLEGSLIVVELDVAELSLHIDVPLSTA
jgi:hypothetical protein